MENQRNQKPNFASSGSDTDNPFSYTTSTTNETMFRRQSCINEANPNSRQEEPPLLFLHFPSPFLDNGDPLLSHLVPLQQDEIMAGVSCFAESETTPQNPKVRLKKRSDHGGAKNPNPRKRTGKTDRHSKIYTAHGPRDRRMRLSVQIARKFFDLQDMLGFDKASKTIEWLFSNSKAAIRELTGNVPPQMNYNYNCSHRRGKSVWSLPECEVAPAMEVQRKGILATKGQSGTLMGVNCVPNDKKRSRKWRKAAYNPRAKESRDMARARARARTREKMIIRSLVTSKQCLDLDLDLESNTNNLELEQLGYLSPFETVYRLRSHRLENNYPPELMEDIQEQRPHSLEHRLATVGIIERFLGTASASSSTSYSILDFQKPPPVPAVSDGVVDHANNSFLGIRGNWDMEDDARINSNYCAALTNVFPLTGNVHEQNPSSTSNIHFQSQFLGNHFSCRPMDGNDSYSLN